MSDETILRQAVGAAAARTAEILDLDAALAALGAQRDEYLALVQQQVTAELTKMTPRQAWSVRLVRHGESTPSRTLYIDNAAYYPAMLALLRKRPYQELDAESGVMPIIVGAVQSATAEFYQQPA